MGNWPRELGTRIPHFAISEPGYLTTLYLQSTFPLTILFNFDLIICRRKGLMRSVNKIPSRWSYSCWITRALKSSNSSTCNLKFSS